MTCGMPWYCALAHAFGFFFYSTPFATPASPPFSSDAKWKWEWPCVGMRRYVEEDNNALRLFLISTIPHAVSLWHFCRPPFATLASVTVSNVAK